PTAIVAGSSGFTLQVTGINFSSGSTVNWNGSPRNTTFISGSLVAAQIFATDVSNSGTASVTVSGKKFTSNSLSFTIIPRLVFSTSAIPSGTVGKSYSFSLSA